MTPKSILVLVDGGPLSDSTLETGLAVASLFGAQVQALHVQADPATLVPTVGEGMSGAMVEQVMDAMSKAVDQRSERAKAAYEKIAARGGAKIAWRLESGPEPVVLAAAGRLSDLIVLGRPDKSMDGQTAASLDAALFDTGRAVMVAPPAAVAPTLCRRVALAWNGSAEASRVVHLHPCLAFADDRNGRLRRGPGAEGRSLAGFFSDRRGAGDLAARRLGSPEGLPAAGLSLVECPLAGGAVERKGRYFDVEVFAAHRHHAVGSSHETGRRRQRHAAGVFVRLAGFERWRFADHAGAAHLLQLAVSVRDLPMAGF